MNHIQCVKHKNGKKRLKSKELRERRIAKMLVKHNEEQHMQGETLPEEQQVYRIKVVTALV